MGHLGPIKPVGRDLNTGVEPAEADSAIGASEPASAVCANSCSHRQNIVSSSSSSSSSSPLALSLDSTQFGKPSENEPPTRLTAPIPFGLRPRFGNDDGDGGGDDK